LIAGDDGLLGRRLSGCRDLERLSEAWNGPRRARPQPGEASPDEGLRSRMIDAPPCCLAAFPKLERGTRRAVFRVEAAAPRLPAGSRPGPRRGGCTVSGRERALDRVTKDHRQWLAASRLTRLIVAVCPASDHCLLSAMLPQLLPRTVRAEEEREVIDPGVICDPRDLPFQGVRGRHNETCRECSASDRSLLCPVL